MKSEEDEAFEELAKRQGDWGGGFKAKQAMAADKLQGPAQEPVAWLTNEELTKLMTDSYDQGVKDALESVKEVLDALPKREWGGLNDEDIETYLDWDDWQVGTDRSIILGMVRDIEAKLRSKNI